MQALFYPLSYQRAKIVDLVAGFLEPDDLVKFADEAGGDVDQALAVPYLPGMDAIVVTDARIVLRAYPQDLDIEAYTVVDNGKQGVFLKLAESSRLRKIEVVYAQPPAPPKTRLVVRAGGGKNGGLEQGVPLFTSPPFEIKSAMFPKPLGGMDVLELGGDRRLLTLPSVLGSAWLIQLASGESPTDLAAVEVKPSIRRVVLEALPRNLSVVLAPGMGPLTLWQNPGVLLPESGEQEVSFTPLAQKHLSAALASAEPTAAALPVPLRFHSDSGGAVEITKRSLAAEYQVRPLGQGPVTVELRGDFARLILSAPAGLNPARSALKITAKLLGRELNAASPEPTLDSPSVGLRVGVEHWVAAASRVAPRAGAASDSVVEIASVRVFVACAEAVEAVLEIRIDSTGSPGEIAAPPIVAAIDRGTRGWREFELPTPLKVVAGNAPIWLVLRTNKGELRWFANPAPPSFEPSAGSRVSSDGGAIWATPSLALGTAGEQLVQLFQHSAGALPAPRVRLQRGASVLLDDWLSAALPKSLREYAIDTALPAAVHALLAARPGEGKADTELLLFSRSALDLVVESATLSYDPFTARAP